MLTIKVLVFYILFGLVLAGIYDYKPLCALVVFLIYWAAMSVLASSVEDNGIERRQNEKI